MSNESTKPQDLLSIYGYTWCYGIRDDSYDSFGFRRGLDALESALEEEPEADTIYIARHSDEDVSLSFNIEEALQSFQERYDIPEEISTLMDNDLKNLEESLTPVMGEVDAIFARWLTQHGLMPMHYRSEMSYSREEAVSLLLHSQPSRKKAITALEQILEDVGWLEAAERNPNEKEEAARALERIRTCCEIALAKEPQESNDVD